MKLLHYELRTLSANVKLTARNLMIQFLILLLMFFFNAIQFILCYFSFNDEVKRVVQRKNIARTKPILLFLYLEKVTHAFLSSY